MKNIFIFAFFVLFVACKNSKIQEGTSVFRKDFTQEELKIISLSKEIIKETYFGTFITIDEKGQPRARVMEPFAPEEEFIIWLATNPKSRKVNQIKANSNTTLHYFDKDNLAYISLMGKAYLVNDMAIKESKWKDGWENFYPNKEKDYLLIKFIPNTIELISIPKKYTGDSITWKPHQVILRN